MHPHNEFPYEETHNLLLLAYGALSEESFDIKQHVALWEEFYPPETDEERIVLQQSCLGRKVKPEHIEEARRSTDD